MPATGAQSGRQEATGEVPRGTCRGGGRAHAARSKGANTDGAPRSAAGEGDRARAADDATQGREPGRSQGTGRARKGASRAPSGGQGAHGAEPGTVGERGRSQGHGHGHGKGTGAGSAGQGVGDRGGDRQQGQGDRGLGAGKGPKGKGKGAVGPQKQAGRGMGARGGGRNKGRGVGDTAPPPPDVQPVRCIPPGIQQMPAHHTHHHHHHHAHLYNIDPDAGELIPPKTPRPQHQPAAPAPRAEPARMASAGGGRDAAAAPQAQGLQGEPARGAGGARPWARDWGTVPDPLGDEALPLVVEVWGWLGWASSGTTRGMRNRPFDALLLRRD